MQDLIPCRELIDFLDCYVDGALPARTARRFEAHLERCPDCVAYLHSYRETIRLEVDAYCEGEAAFEDVPRALIEAILDARRTSAG